ncbi:PH, RCC1 and FYVE domains-containing protein 1-like [Vicia villosa]|uniref:PH, RCC1 and FYVE domains-containing protein 1-like n=1 Tax=Vicia villosa TaxID=3911 RepID=UPI00273B38F5|nr:PH, RCC1 and FYVE domains-containing protein 1-like [Vicia villosa]XP_058729416.1 PH, RCC1 and FYVE domains-containing protein 1-like [Vicia villosa]
MQPRASTGASFRFSASSTPSNSSGGSDPDDVESQGEVFIWGEVFADGVPSKTDVLIPKLLESHVILDVRNIASGASHLAILNKKGEVFTWGEESGGRLGHGIDKSSGKPRLVENLEDVTLDIVACGEFHTCAVSKSDEFFTWGDGTHNAGLLGHGNEASHWIPKSVDGFLDGLQVVSVACGTWHSALATSNGKLFTFGDGTFGVLGHGDQESVSYPKEVQLLGGLRTIKVACGVWHTAAIVEVVFQSGSNVSSWKLFTWGDGDKHCLGHGNKETYLQPTRVSPLIEYNFLQIACGHTMTVALTTSGHVFTMGSTENGQLGNPNSAGKVPTLVQDKLLGEFVEEISCGAHHVAVLTSRSEVYTWGKGSNGRLGHGDTDERKSPTLVVALKDRNIKNISCGSNFTSCICIRKLVTGADQSACFGCKQAFGLTRKRHNCYNCGLVFCHTCSSKKSFKAALAPTFEKPHRVCDICYTKLKVVDINDPSKLNGKANPSHYSTNGRERLDQGTLRSTRTLFSSFTEPVKYLEIRNNKPGTEYGSTSFIRASLVPSLLQLKDIGFPSSLSSIQSVLKPSTPPSSSQNSSFPYTCRSSPSPPYVTQRFSGGLINSLSRTNDVLNQRVSNLQSQIRDLEERSDVKDLEIQKLQRKTTEVIAWVAVESSCHREAKQFIESTKHQLKEMTEKLPAEIPERNILSTIQTRAEDFLKEYFESETSELESKQQSSHDISAADNDSSKLENIRLVENADIVEVDSCLDESKLECLQQSAHDISAADNDDSSKLENIRLVENADIVEVDACPDEFKLECLQQNALDISTTHSGNFELQDHRLVENADIVEVDSCLDEPKLECLQQIAHDISATDIDSSKLENIQLIENADIIEVDSCLAESKLECLQQNALDISTPDSGNLELQDHRLEENADVKVDSCQDEGNFLDECNKQTLESKQHNSPDITTSDSETSKLQEQIYEKIDKTARCDQSETGINVRHESNGSSISSVGEVMSPQSSENGSISGDSSRDGSLQETQVFEKFESGIYVLLKLRADGIKIFKRVKFSKRKFTESQAEEWWSQNKGRVLRKYCPRHQKQNGSCNFTPNVKENIESSLS